MTVHMTLPDLIRNAFAFPALASQHQDAIAKAMRASEFKYPPLLPCMGKTNGHRNGRQNEILSLLSDGKGRTLVEIAEGLEVEDRKTLSSAINRAVEADLILFYTVTGRKRGYRISQQGRAALEKAGIHGGAEA